MKQVLAALFASIAVFTANAADQLPLIQPQSSGLALKSLESRYTTAKFTGRMTVVGTLIAQWVIGVDQPSDNTRQYRLVPDPGSAAALPYFQGYPVQKIEVLNGLAALQMVGGKQVADTFRRKRVKVVRAEGVFEITDFVVGVECDAQWAKAVIIRVNPPDSLALSNSPEPFGC